MSTQPGVVRRTWNRLKEGEPGKRFRDLYDHPASRRSGSPPSRVLTLAAGVALTMFGLAVGWLPGPGGFVAILGLALLATVWRPLANALDTTEMGTRRLWRRLRA